MDKNNNDWAAFGWHDFAPDEASRLIAVLPLAATEQHGPHLPLSVDAAVVGGVVERLARKLPEESPVLFLPRQSIGKSNEHARYPGTLTHSAATLIAMWCEIGACVAASGVRKMVLLNSHGGNISTMDIVARELRVRHDMLVFSVSWFGLGMPEGLYSDHELRHGIHAGDMETSVMLALDAPNVVMDKARDFHPANADWQDRFRHIALGGGAKPGWQAQDLNAAGACGDATLATAAKGEATLDFAVDRLAELFAEIERFPLASLDTRPAW